MNREIPNTKNIVDLSNIESRDLMLELKSRGYYTDLIFGIGDVDFQLESINDGRDEADHIKLDESEKRDILDSCFNTDWYCERMNDDLSDEILNHYDS
jgi:hypothetical protein